MAYRVLITGDRKWTCHALAREVIARLKMKHEDIDIVQGAATGVDHAFVEAAYEAGCGVASFPAGVDVRPRGVRGAPPRAARAARGDGLMSGPHGEDGPDHATDAPEIRHEAIGGEDVESISWDAWR